ncbi:MULTISPECIES: FimV/HubP family polar landmark protein [Pseudomonas]|uniref:FimV/HubP family polar landmark protein n=1 Tax=Pseudomonas TaxID=286 RepID=UPI0010708B31|nr:MULTISPECIES: FimV/HubP family polar landmark protein [Pseudomonas]QBR30923.1 LPXTG cell wall anchor domain-containing protein [Pseudomonas sp. S150]UZT94435.1 LPXTG cell wall anchor domain-containing protein [Pseudomonas koreensis]
MHASRHVVLRGGARWLLVAGVFSYSTWSMALGLGDITVHSGLNQPLKADIALVDAAGLSASDLSASLATADEFGRAGVERVFFLNDLKFTPILHGDRQMIRVTSRKPVNEPFLNFLVQLDQPNGRLLREYTLLIDPPGSPSIVPATDEPDPRPQSSEFPTVEPATAAPQAAQGKRDAAPSAPPPPATAAPANDAVAEQLAASALLNQQLQKTVEELNTKLQAQDIQLADGKKQISDLQTRLSELQQPPAPALTPPTPAPVTTAPEAADDGLNWPLLGGLLMLLGLLGAGLFVRRRRQLVEGAAPLAALPADRQTDPEDPPTTQSASIRAATEHREEPAAGDVLEAVGIYLAYGRLSEAVGLLRNAMDKEPERTELGVQLLEVLGRQGDSAAYEQQEHRLRDAGVDPQQLAAIRERHSKLTGAAPITPVLPIAAAAAVAPAPPAAEDDFELNLGELSMASSWDLEDSRSTPEQPVERTASNSDLEILPPDFELPETVASEEAELEWIPEPDAQPLDDDFLNEFGDPGELLALEPLDLAATEPEHGSEKLEQAQTCIDDGDIDSAIALLNELLKEGDEPLRQTARTLLAGIR